MTSLGPRAATADALSEQQVHQLIRQWQSRSDVVARDELIEAFMETARRLSRRYQGGIEPREDLEQVAYLGLVQAVNRFDTDSGKTFISFLVPTVLGNLRRHFRDHGWSVHVTRGTKETALRVRAAQRELEAQGLAVTVPALSERLGLSNEQILDAMEASAGQYSISYDTPDNDEADSAPAVNRFLAVHEPGYAQVEGRDVLARAVAKLTPAEREILVLRYGRDLSQSEIGSATGVSQMQVSKVLRRIHDKLAGQLTDLGGRPVAAPATEVVDRRIRSRSITR